MKIIIVALSAFLAVATAIPPQKTNEVEKIFDTLTNIFQTEDLHQILTDIGDDKSDRLCPLCQKFVTALDSFLGDVKVQTKLSAAVAKVCDKISDENKKQACTNLITKDFPMVLEIVKSLLNPTTVCVKLFKMCPSPSSNTDLDSSSNPFIQPFEQTLECAACFTAFGFVRQAFLNPDFGKFCVDEIQPVCDGLSDPEKHQKCLDTVTKLVGQIFKALNTYLDPFHMCQTVIPGKTPDGCPTAFLNKFKH